MDRAATAAAHGEGGLSFPSDWERSRSRAPLQTALGVHAAPNLPWARPPLQTALDLCTQADEEGLLLEAVDAYGMGNWVAVADHVGPTKTPLQCKARPSLCPPPRLLVPRRPSTRAPRCSCRPGSAAAASGRAGERIAREAERDLQQQRGRRIADGVIMMQSAATLTGSLSCCVFVLAPCAGALLPGLHRRAVLPPAHAHARHAATGEDHTHANRQANLRAANPLAGVVVGLRGNAAALQAVASALSGQQLSP